MIEQPIHCAITNAHSGAMQLRSGLNYHLTSVTVKLLQFERLSVALVDSVSLRPSLLLAAARQQRRRGARMINNDWQALGVGLVDMREITRIIISNTVRINLPTWLRSQPYLVSTYESKQQILQCRSSSEIDYRNKS